MSQLTTKKLMILFCLITLVAPMLMGATTMPASSGGKQIVFMLADPSLKLTYMTIQGTNQRGDYVTWEFSSPNGVRLAYTKNWWWVGDYVRMKFAWIDTRTKESSYASCSIDALVQPKDTAYVYILFDPKNGCAGGEGGSAGNPVAQSMKPIKKALDTADYYLSDFDMQVFIETLQYEAYAGACVVAVATAFQTGGATLALAQATVAGSCSKAVEKTLKKVILK